MFKRFSKRQNSEANDFRERVLTVTARLFPDLLVIASKDEEVIIVNRVQLGLQNLKAKFMLSDRSEESLQALIAEHFAGVINAVPEVPDFEMARLRLRPQIMPPEFVRQAPILSFPFGKTLKVGIVLDEANSYTYVLQEDSTKWGISHPDLLQKAIASLDDAIRGKTRMQCSEKDSTKWVGIETKDGFDAARILIPGFQKFISARLGGPFRFAVPNRDFLICWNREADESFVEFATSKIRADFEAQPYPLSPNIFQLEPNGDVIELI
ncbi:MAG: hypothetical protein ACXW32_09790 [Limisphaerales bacterium]